MGTQQNIGQPLRGIRVVEFEGLGPGALAARMLADLGADVTAIVRPGPVVAMDRLGGTDFNPLRRGKCIEAVDLKTPHGLARARELVAAADVLIEGNRPGVMERLGLGPADCAVNNPALVYGRMTGLGATWPHVASGGHDLNYVALTGLLSLATRDGRPPIVPPTVVGDAAGALGLAFGLKSRMETLFRGRTRAYWCGLLEGSDACFAPVLSLAEAPAHPHHQARGTYRSNVQGAISVAPAPRFLPLD